MVYQTFHRSLDSQISIVSKTFETHKAVEALEKCLSENLSIVSSHSAPIPIEANAVANEALGPCLYCQSSGSSNKAKTIRRSPASWIGSFKANQTRFSLSRHDRYAVLGALSHSLTLYAMLEALHIGANLSILSGVQPRTQLMTIQDSALTVLYATPSQLRLLLEGSKASFPVAPNRLPTVRFILCGGGKLDASSRSGLSSLCPNASIFEFYGASETSFITMAASDTPRGSVGPCYPGVEMTILGKDGKPTDGIGEIWVKSPYLFDGYEIGESTDTYWKDGYLTVGEMGRLDPAGNLFLKGRKSRMVTVADQNVFLEDVEAALHHDPDVRNCAVFARPDKQRGHVVVAVVEASETADLIERLQTICRSSVGTLATPKRIYFIDSMPMLPAGKPDLVALHKWQEQQA